MSESLKCILFRISIKIIVLMMSIMFLTSVLEASESDEAYDALVERVKQSDQSVDFAKLRLAYTKTSAYSPYGATEAEGKVRTAMDQGEFEDALKYADIVLKNKYVDIETHIVCSIANKRLGRTEKENYHKSIAYKLLESIAASGDGKSPETAYFVISTNEEYLLMRFMLGVNPEEQSLITSNGHYFDKFKIVDTETGKPSEIYFNIDIPFNWLGKLLK